MGFALAAVSVACASAPQATPTGEAPRSNPRPDELRAAAPLVERAIDLGLEGHHAEALPLLDEAEARAPLSLAAGVARVETLLALDRRAEALAYAERLAEAHPASAYAAYALGKAHLSLVRISEAEAAFRGALALAPDDLPALIGLLACQVHRGPSDELAELSAEVSARAPGNAWALHTLGTAAEVRGELDAARALYERALSLAPDLAAAHYNLARLIEEAEGLDAARTHYEAFLRVAGPERARLAEQVTTHLKVSAEEAQ